MAGRPYKFPTPSGCKLKHCAVLCTAERILALYNQENNAARKRITGKITSWFSMIAAEKGWAGCCFLPEVQSGHGAGCVLFVQPLQTNVKITVTNETLVLIADK